MPNAQSKPPTDTPIVALAGHPRRPLAQWCLYLCKRAGDARDIACTGTLRASDIAERVALLLGADVPDTAPDLTGLAPLLGGSSHLFDLDRILSTLIGAALLDIHDPEFPWAHAIGIGLPSGIDAFDLPWRQREEARLFTGRYAPLPWANQLAPIPDHFAHLSERPGLIAYTQSDMKGAADIQTPMKAGRYLARYYPDLAPHQVRDLVALIPRAATLQFAVTADDIETIYTRGPKSCMSHPAGYFDGPCHPVRVFGDSDLHLAYVANRDGEPTARTLVWPEKKRHSRIYGDEILIAPLLEAAGFTRASLRGARIRRIDCDNNVVMPYLDEARSFDIVDDDWLSIGGPFPAEATNGIASIAERATCDYCDESVDRDDLDTVDGERWCSDCRDNHAFISDFSDQAFRNNDRVDVIVDRRKGTSVYQDWADCEADSHATYCRGSDAYYQTDNFQFVRLRNGDTWVKWYFIEHGNPADLADPPEAIAGDNDNTATEHREAA